MHHAQHSEMALCIEACLACYRDCQQMAMTHCLETGGEHVKPDHFRLMIDCAEACRAAAALMLNDSPYHAASCELCAQICRDCAESCRQLDDMDECAQSCEECAEACEAMASTGFAQRQGSGMQTGSQVM